MKLNTISIMIAVVIVGIFSIGFLSCFQLPASSAQSAGFPGLDKLPGFDIFKGLISGDNNNKNPSVTSNPDYLDLDKAVVASAANKVQAVLQAHGHIPTNGNGGAFGYGILTSQGLNAIMVSTTHKGVLDSEDQRNANDPKWHNHYVSLGTDSTHCDSNPAVTSITFQSPGDVVVNQDKAVMSNLPAKFTGTNALTGNPLTLNPGTNVQDVVSFKLQPVFSPTHQLQAVCVTDIQPADKVIKN